MFKLLFIELKQSINLFYDIYNKINIVLFYDIWYNLNRMVSLMNLKKEIVALETLLNLTQFELAKKLDVSFETINRWISEKHDVEDYNVEKVYSFSFKNKVFLNRIFEQLVKEEETINVRILFHGCKQQLYFPLDLNYSKLNNDFGIGFYMGENLKQASTYISNSKSTKVYVFKLLLDDLKMVRFNVSREWMLAIAYYRGWINQYKENGIIKEIINKVEESDIIVAPIADNKMFDIISEFVRGEITDLQCQHALTSTNLGMQFVARTDKALSNISLIRLCYISRPEKETNIKERLALNSVTEDKVKLARIEYRGKGNYIDELLK